MSYLHFTLDGEPIPKGRPRVGKKKDGSTQVYTPERTKQAELDLGWAFKAAYPGHEPFTGEVAVMLQFFTSKQTADIDNYAKTVLDALNEIAWADDRQVTSLTCYLKRDYEAEPFTTVQLRARDLEP
jgi:crossover junction endodeoxyribonuclease RusA